MVDIASKRGKIITCVRVCRKAVPGTVFIPFHDAWAAANKLTDSALNPVSGIPEHKVCAVNLSRAA